MNTIVSVEELTQLRTDIRLAEPIDGFMAREAWGSATMRIDDLLAKAQAVPEATDATPPGFPVAGGASNCYG